MLGPAKPLTEIKESDWDGQLFRSRGGVARLLGWRLCYHTLRSRGSQPGFPDRVIVRDRVIFVELKRELTGKKSEDKNRVPSETQVDWLTGLAKGGAEVYLWRPSDLDEIGLILGGQWLWLAGSHALVPKTHELGRPPSWQPCSLWLPEGRRAGAA